MRLVRFAAATLITQAAVFTASSAGAAVVYSYTGNNFTNVFAPGYTTSDKITGTLTLSSALPASLSILTNEAALVLSYDFSDGVHSYTSPCCDSGSQTTFDFSTDAGGHITNWDVTLETDDNHTGDLTTIGGASGLDQSLRGGVLGGDNVGIPGVWSVQTLTTGVPEPATWALFLLGFGATGWTLRRGRKPSPAAVLE
jgi:hypothetical protein